MSEVVQSGHRDKEGTMQAECPECAAAVALDSTVVGEILRCPDCGADLEVISLDPPVLELAPTEEEDWGE